MSFYYVPDTMLVAGDNVQVIVPLLLIVYRWETQRPRNINGQSKRSPKWSIDFFLIDSFNVYFPVSFPKLEKAGFGSKCHWQHTKIKIGLFCFPQQGEHFPENLRSVPVMGSWEGHLTGFEIVLDISAVEKQGQFSHEVIVIW